jgi:RNA polymerase sigma factor (sigma-70 family)
MHNGGGMASIREVGAQIQSTIDDLPVGLVAAAIERLREAQNSLQLIIRDQAGEANSSALENPANGIAESAQHAETAHTALQAAVGGLAAYLTSIGLTREGSTPGQSASPSDEHAPEPPLEGERTEAGGQPAEAPEDDSEQDLVELINKDPAKNSIEEVQTDGPDNDANKKEPKEDPAEAFKRINRELVERIQQGDKEALDEFLKRNAGLLWVIGEEILARTNTNGLIDMDEIMQIAYGITIGALGRYDPSKGEVSSYIGAAVRYKLQRELDAIGHGVRVGPRMKRIMGELLALNTERLNQGKPPLTDAEISAHFTRNNPETGKPEVLPRTDAEAGARLSAESVRRAFNLRSRLRGHYAGDSRTTDPDNSHDIKESWTDRPTRGESPENPADVIVEKEQRRRAVAQLLGVLRDPRERDIIERRMGLGGRATAQSQYEVAADLGISETRVQQLEARAMERMHAAKRDGRVKDPDASDE